jgi:hypothetical protein
MDERLLIIASDGHEGDRDADDRGDRTKGDRTIALACELGARELVLNGDWFEGYKDTLARIQAANEALWRRRAHDLNLAGVAVTLVDGNHDRAIVARMAAWLHEVCGLSRVTAERGPIWRGSWVVMHGDLFDPFVSRWGLRHLARAGCLFAAGMEHLGVPFPEDVFSPVNWFSPAADGDRREAVFRAACAWAQRQQCRLVIGHDHVADIAGDGLSWQVLDCGAATRQAPCWSCVQICDDRATLVKGAG